MISSAPARVHDRRWYEPAAVHAWRRRRRLAALRDGGRRLVFIAGCARSGTSLLKQLMAVFDDTAVYPRERTVWHFLEMADAPEATLVVKRTADCHRSLHRLPAAVDLVYCVRHPYDCLTSTHPLTSHLRPYHVTRDRWFAEYAALHRLQAGQPHRRITYVRYEDLVARPDDVQAAIAADLGLTAAGSFSRNPLGIEILPASVEKWRTRPALRDHLAGLDAAWHRAIGRFCAEFGYGPARQG
ncbi:MAG: sulfotransferase [Planctomycetia bacterium]